jgi:hypothetical protein
MHLKVCLENSHILACVRLDDADPLELFDLLAKHINAHPRDINGNRQNVWTYYKWFYAASPLVELRATLHFLLDYGLLLDEPNESEKIAINRPPFIADKLTLWNQMINLFVAKVTKSDAIKHNKNDNDNEKYQKSIGLVAMTLGCGASVFTCNHSIIELLILSTDPRFQAYAIAAMAHEMPHLVNPVLLQSPLVVTAERHLQRERFLRVKERAIQIGIGLQSLQLPALITLYILDELLINMKLVPFHIKWQLVTTIKHFKNNKSVYKLVVDEIKLFCLCRKACKVASRAPLARQLRKDWIADARRRINFVERRKRQRRAILIVLVDREPAGTHAVYTKQMPISCSTIPCSTLLTFLVFSTTIGHQILLNQHAREHMQCRFRHIGVIVRGALVRRLQTFACVHVDNVGRRLGALEQRQHALGDNIDRNCVDIENVAQLVVADLFVAERPRVGVLRVDKERVAVAVLRGGRVSLLGSLLLARRNRLRCAIDQNIEALKLGFDLDAQVVERRRRIAARHLLQIERHDKETLRKRAIVRIRSKQLQCAVGKASGDKDSGARLNQL